MNIFNQKFGSLPDGEEVTLYTLKNDNGLQVGIMDYGATIVSILCPDKDGNFDDITLGFDNLQQYLDESPYFGSTVGRVANRITNAKFTLDGVEYKLAENNGIHSLHGGLKGFDKVVWDVESELTEDEATLVFRYTSKDGEEGFPGNLTVVTTYKFNNSNELSIVFEAETDKATPVNMTNHAYFNLAGQGRGDILKHKAQIVADGYTVVDEGLAPTGEIASVKETPMDFNEPMEIGARVDQVPGGYDHNYVLAKENGVYALAAKVYEPNAGRELEVWTSEPGVQFYISGQMDDTKGKNGVFYTKFSGFCLEPQKFPDSVNHSNFPSCILRPGEKYIHKMAYIFNVK